MSSTSLSSCDNCDYYPCNYVLEDSYDRYRQPYQGPFYNTMGQPLVYYAEVQSYCRRPNKARHKDNRNCFARAFKWYTQEREPECPRRVSPELSGFATWLDTKYGEYLRESECQSGCPTQPMDAVHCAPCTPRQTNEPGTTKRYSRMRSPWRKFRGQNKNGGDVPCKTPNGSCQFILQPKDLTRPASECYQTPIIIPNKSNITVISTEIEGVKKIIVKSQSLTSICRDKISKNCDDLVTPHEGTRQMDTQKRGVMEKVPRGPPTRLSPCDQSCKTREESKIVAKIQINSGNVQETVISCNASCYKQNNKPTEERHMSAQPPYKEIPCDPKCGKLGSKPVQEIQFPEKSQNDNIPYNVNSCKQECTPMGEIRVFIQAQNTEIPCNPNCKQRKPIEEMHSPITDNICDLSCYQEQNKPLDNRQAMQQNVNNSYDIRCYRQECKATEDIKQGVQHIKDISCDPTCIYKPQTRSTSTIQNIPISQTPASQNMTETCDPSCYKQVGLLERIYTRSQMKDIPCNTNCIYKQEHNPGREILLPVKPPVIPCDQTCNKREYEHVEEILCKSKCMHMKEYTPVAVATRLPNIDNSCNPYCPNIPEEQTAKELQVPLKTQIVNTSYDPNRYKQPFAIGEIPRASSKSQRLEVSCMCYTNKSASEIKKSSSKIQQVDHECQCHDDESLPVDAQVQWENSRQTVASTSTNYALCKCILEKQLIIPVQMPPRKPPQPPTPIVSLHAPCKSQKPLQTNDVSCQCPEVDIKIFDTPYQYGRYHTESHSDCVCPTAKPVKPRIIGNVQRPESRTMMNYSSLAVRQVTRSLTTFRNDAVQTSDHSICLEDVGHDYAFFMKIVCADKLNDCFCDSFTR